MIISTKGDYNQAIEDFATVIHLKSDYAPAYIRRGIAYGAKADYERAIKDYTKAIDLTPDSVIAYYNRGLAWLYLGKQEKARADLTDAKNMGMDIITAFQYFYESVSDFEERSGSRYLQTSPPC